MLLDFYNCDHPGTHFSVRLIFRVGDHISQLSEKERGNIVYGFRFDVRINILVCPVKKKTEKMYEAGK